MEICQCNLLLSQSREALSKNEQAIIQKGLDEFGGTGMKLNSQL